ncbi:MAG: hypothetical protein VW683_12630 [Betaproteobacteria bacterium]
MKVGDLVRFNGFVCLIKELGKRLYIPYAVITIMSNGLEMVCDLDDLELLS